MYDCESDKYTLIYGDRGGYNYSIYYYIRSPNAFDFIDFNNKNRYFIDYPVLENEYDKFIISIKEILEI